MTKSDFVPAPLRPEALRIPRSASIVQTTQKSRGRSSRLSHDPSYDLPLVTRSRQFVSPYESLESLNARPFEQKFHRLQCYLQ